jgi:hypothetical protein
MAQQLELDMIEHRFCCYLTLLVVSPGPLPGIRMCARGIPSLPGTVASTSLSEGSLIFR